MGMTSLLLEIFKELMTAWREGGRKIRLALGISVALIVLGALVVFVSNVVLWYTPLSKVGENVGGAIAVVGALVALSVFAIQKSKEEARREERIEAVERRVQENPRETQAAWELARVKLESYLNRNLSQVRSIFWLTLLVMSAGFSLIGFGVYEAFQDPIKFPASLLTTSAGIIVSFIGGTFLVLYKATMAQAKDYVTILERINAVGMSVQILDTIDSNATTLKHQTTADVAKLLLSMYAGDLTHSKRIQRSRQTRAADA